MLLTGYDKKLLACNLVDDIPWLRLKNLKWNTPSENYWKLRKAMFQYIRELISKYTVIKFSQPAGIKKLNLKEKGAAPVSLICASRNIESDLGPWVLAQKRKILKYGFKDFRLPLPWISWINFVVSFLISIYFFKPRLLLIYWQLLKKLILGTNTYLHPI